MKSELNKGRARQLYESLSGTHSIEEWLKIIIITLGFLLVRYIDEE